MPVACQKFPDTKRPRAVHRPDEDDVAISAVDQFGAPQDERPHQDVAQFGVRLNDTEELLAADLDDLTRLAHAQPCHRAPSGQHVALAGKLPGLQRDDERLTVRRPPQHLNRAAEDDETCGASVADVVENITARNGTAAAVRGDSRDLRGAQRREEFVLIHWSLALVSFSHAACGNALSSSGW